MKIKNTIVPAILSISFACTQPTATPSVLTLQGVMLTKVMPEKTTITSRLQWNSVWGVNYYEVVRVENGKETNVATPKVPTSTLSLLDSSTSLTETGEYKYIVRAIDANNKLISQGETGKLKPIGSNVLAKVDIQNLKAFPEVNTVSRLENITWSSSTAADLYYPEIINSTTNKQIFGVLTKDPTINLNINGSPILPTGILTQELPMLTNGMEKGVEHRFSVYSIKFDNKEKPTSVGIRKSDEFKLMI
jgi:hypothetical protein